MTLRVIVADDQAAVREAFAVLLDAQPDIKVVATAENGAAAIAHTAALTPDVVVLDVRMPVVDGIEATRRIAPATKVLVLTTFDLDSYVYDALRAGASGFLLKDASGRELADAVRVVARGDALLAPTVTRRLLSEFTRLGSARRSATSGTELLTPRETEVLVHIARGQSNTEIATELVVAEETIKTHVGRILRKLNLRDRTQAAVFAYESGLVEPGDVEHH